MSTRWPSLIALALAALCRIAGVSAAPGDPLGGEFVVSQNSPGAPSVAVSATGAFVVAWGEAADDLAPIRARRYDAQGQAQGGELLLASPVRGFAREASVDMDDSGNFVVAWSLYSERGTADVVAQRFDASGAPLADAFQVSTSEPDGQQSRPQVALDSAGNFVIAWQKFSASAPGIAARRFDRNGLALGGEFQANGAGASLRMSPAVAMDPGGAFVIAWQSLDQDGDNFGIYAQRYSLSGAPVDGEFQVNSLGAGRQDEPRITSDAAGNFTVSWHSRSELGDDGVRAQAFDASGARRGGEFQAAPPTGLCCSPHSISASANGQLMIAWVDFDEGQDIYARRLDAGGAPLGAVFKVNSQIAFDQFFPAIATDAAGNFVLAWLNESERIPGPVEDLSVFDVRAQRYEGGEDSAVDLTPDSFGFAERTVPGRAARVASDAVRIGGLGRDGASISAGGDPSTEYRINQRPYTRAPGRIRNGDLLRLRLKSPDAPGLSAIGLVSVGDYSASFRVRTRTRP